MNKVVAAVVAVVGLVLLVVSVGVLAPAVAAVVGAWAWSAVFTWHALVAFVVGVVGAGMVLHALDEVH